MTVNHMRSRNNSFDWRGKPSEIGVSLGRIQTPPKVPPTPLTFTRKQQHPLRNATSSINTERKKSHRVTKAAI